MLTITTPADDVALLDTAELRAAAGVTAGDSSQDTVLGPLGLRVAAEISAACGVAIGAGNPPTLLQETLTETFRDVRRDVLVLSRRHDVAITSVTVDGTVLAAEYYEVEPESGLLYRLSGDSQICWAASKIIVIYEAGFETVPPDLSGAAADMVALRWAEMSRDPLLKSEMTEVPGVETRRQDYWVGALGGQSGGGVPDYITARLSRYVNVRLG